MGSRDRCQSDGETGSRQTRRAFLLLAGCAAAGAGASPALTAAGLGERLKGLWLFQRLAERRPKLLPGVKRWTGSGGEARVGLNETEPMVALNETAFFLLECCRGDRTVREIAASLHHVYAAPIWEARRDAAATIRAFHRLGFIEI